MTRYYSTNLSAPVAGFDHALIQGLAPDGGLYMPVEIPPMGRNEMEAFSTAGYSDIAASVLGKFLDGLIGRDELAAMAGDAYNFDIPLEEVKDDLFIMRLDRGPTASFKDFAARMMARLMQHFIRLQNRRLVVLVATSGDTGSAIANAYHNLEGTDVVILFPVSEVSENQRRQMTTLGGNVTTLAVDGKFDDCQRLVKQAFNDPAFASAGLTSANSINIGRLLPQAVYYFHAWSRLAGKGNGTIDFAVPSGNFGNMMGGVIAREMGLPVSRFIIATNGNNEFPEYLRTGVYKPLVPSVNSISNAMNVGHPSNLARLVTLYGGFMNERGVISAEPDMLRMKRDIWSISVSDEETMVTIGEYFSKRHVLLEPHGATAAYAAEEYRKAVSAAGVVNKITVVLETAHPAKFPDIVAAATGKLPVVPGTLAGLESRPESFERCGTDYAEFSGMLKRII